MSETATQLEQGYLPAPGEKVRLLTLNALDGRTRSVKRVKDFESQVSTDLGGDLSASQAALVRRGAVLAAILDDSEARWAKDGSLDLPDYLAAINALRRVLTTLGIERQPRRVPGAPVLLGDSL